MTYALILNFVLLVLVSFLVVGLLRAYAEVIRRLHELGEATAPSPSAIAGNGTPSIAAENNLGASVGEVAFPIRGHRPGGGATSIDFSGNNREQGVLITFLTAGCVSCGSIWQSLQQSQEEIQELGIARIVAVTKGADEEDAIRVTRLAGEFTDVIMSSDAFGLYGVDFAPYYVLVKPTGEIAGVGSAQSWRQMLEMIREATLDEDFAARVVPRRGLLSMLGRRSGHAFSSVEAPKQQAIRAEAELAAAGIGPGHPSLYPDGEA